ncbi:ubiquitin carboxyl-terminal hydrolase 12-like [Olea europaea var. sylvestris]|uniref:ubiquitin carboxyl-terminal hydrolase 12-like n=1 Tax=Olea europaea var. sylvestris TaxID=158386 RepID=UPI000C1D3814|nr:ubiquitin carboxyl-terminal hydrolase 12-like [Olea europaea var. sylvestris]
MTMLTPRPLDRQEDEEMLVPHADFVEGPQPLVEGPQPLVEGPQPMEVAPVDGAGTVDNQASEEPQASRFTWAIENFSRLNVKKLYSDVFTVGGYKWRVLIFPKGNNVDYLSMYLDVADSATLPHGWNRYAQFSLAVVNQIHNKYTIRKDTQHQFSQRESDWGFTSFMPLVELYDPSKGYLVNDTCVVEADVAVRKVTDYWTYDSKKETGYVGLKNQGATCYMNSLLQTLYHIPYFRKAVYHMPTTENDMPSGSIPLALQSLFYKLQYHETSVATKELTKSFGWDTYDSFMQHDVQELNRVLCEKLEDKMKGTVVEGTIQKLFEGHHMNYIECINVDFKSTRKESFYDLQLDVKGCKDVYVSFDKYVEVERLEGDNKYHAEEHGLQDAKKGVLFIDFPPVLQLQLKRFEYDFMRDTMVKINDRYEFPLELDLDRDNGKYLSPEADRSVRNLYMLHRLISFYTYLSDSRQIVHFRALERPKEDGFSLELAKNHTYDDVVERVAQYLGLDDPSKIRLTPHNCYSQQPKPSPIKYRSVDQLLDMLVHYNQISDILYYEVLDIPLPELQCLKTLKVAFHHATKDEAVILNIRLPKQSTVGDVLNEIKTKVELSHPNAELRLLEVFYHKIYKIFPLNEKIENINDQYWTLRAEEIPEEEKKLGPNDRLVHVYHFTKESAQNQMQVQNFGEPFFLVIHEGETLADVKVRIQKKLQVPDEEFSKWKFAFLSLGRPEYLQDSDIVSSRFQRRDVYGAWEQYLGLEHSDTTPKRTYAANQNRHTFEKPVKIYN